MTRNGIKNSALIVLTLLVGYLSWLLLDRSVSLTYAGAQQGYLEASLNSAVRLLNVNSRGASRDEILKQVRMEFASNDVLIKGSAIYINDLAFIFNGDRLVKVELVNNLTSAEMDQLDGQ
jgi:hypothetical protein